MVESEAFSLQMIQWRTLKFLMSFGQELIESNAILGTNVSLK